MRSIVAALSLATALTAVCVAEGKTNLFPLGSRTTWTLSSAEGHELTITAKRSGASYLLRGFPGLAAVRVRLDEGNVEAWDARRARWTPFLPLAERERARYRVDVPGSPLWRAVDVTVESRGDVCRIGSRDVRGCVTLAVRSRKPVADAGVERLVFAPGLGPVEIVVQTIAGPREYVLGGFGPRLG